ncbi:MAG: hypothetical protein LBN92_01225, partial [Treponema sp.]|nr:hypothetical protein [Treponema sp.]
MKPRNSIYFTEQAPTREECERRVYAKYGDNVFLGPFKTVWRGGFFGIGGHEEWEVTGKVTTPESPLRPRELRPLDFEAERQKILAARGKADLAEAKRDAAMDTVLKEIRGLSEKVEQARLAALPVPAAETAEHAVLKRLEED